MANILEVNRPNNIITLGTTGTTINVASHTASLLLSLDASKNLESVSDLTAWVAGTANQIIVADDTDGTITISTPQNIHTSATPEFTGVLVGAAGINRASGLLVLGIGGTPEIGIASGVVDFRGKITAGSFGSPLDVTNTREYGVELHYSGNNYNATTIRARAHAVTSDTAAQFQGGLFQAANNNGIDVGVLNGIVSEAIGKSGSTSAAIGTMRGGLSGAEWGAKDTVTNLFGHHIRVHSLNAAGEGSFGTGYGLYIENEAVGGNGQALDAGIYLKGTNLSAGNKAFTYGIDFSGATYGTADIKLSDGGVINDSNNYWGVGLASPSYKFSIGSADNSDQIGIYHDNTNAFIKWNDGELNLITDEGSNTTTVINIKGKGVGAGNLKVYDEDDAEYLEFFTGFGIAYLRTGGTSSGEMRFQDTAHANISLFSSAASGETRELKIYGYRAGDASRILEIGVGVDANDAASFDGLSNYLFDGTIKSTSGAQLGDGGVTNYTSLAANGLQTMVGTARVKKEFTIDAINLDKGNQGPDAVILGNSIGYSYDIGDDSVMNFEIPYDCDTSEDIKVEIYWYIDEAYAANSGEVQWRAQWSACPADASEAIDAPTHTGTIDFGDQNIPATAKFLTEVSGTIAAASIADADFVSMTIDRVALDGGSNPTADPVIVQIEIEYTSNKLGKAT